MMFVIRTSGERPDAAGIVIKKIRKTPAIVPGGAGTADYFCLGPPEASATLREAGWTIVDLHDGWYEDDEGGGIAIWGQGRYWEIRDTPFTVAERAPPEASAEAAAPADSDQVNVRRAIFGA